MAQLNDTNINGNLSLTGDIDINGQLRGGGVESLIENSFEFKLLRSAYPVTTNSGKISGWSVVDSKGSNFIVNSDGTITIGSNIHCIRVWGLVEGACASGRGWGHLYWTHNGTTNTVSGLEYGSYSTVPLYVVINVTQGDTLWLEWTELASINSDGLKSWFCLEKIF